MRGVSRPMYGFHTPEMAAQRTLFPRSSIDRKLRPVDIDNPDGLLLPGAYVVVHLKLPAAIRSVTVPANTLLFTREGLRVAVVRSGRAELVPVAIGRDYGASVEIVSGIRASDSIILDPSDSLENSAPVRLQARGGRSKRVQRSPFL